MEANLLIKEEKMKESFPVILTVNGVQDEYFFKNSPITFLGTLRLMYKGEKIFETEIYVDEIGEEYE